VLLASGDYLLWNWSLNGNRDILALIAGTTLMPLVIAIAWLLVVSVARFLAEVAQRPRAGTGTSASSEARGHGARRSAARAAAAGRAATSARTATGAPAAHRNQRAGSVADTDSSPSTPSSSSKLAA
jgi:hypothetical protein